MIHLSKCFFEYFDDIFPQYKNITHQTTNQLAKF